MVHLRRGYFDKNERIFDTIEFFAFTIRFASTEDELFRQLHDSIHGERVVIISDRLATETHDGHFEPSDLTNRIRRFFVERPNLLCGMVALVNGNVHRTTDIDVMLDCRRLRHAPLKYAILRVGHALWLKSPFRTPDRLSANDAVIVEAVRSKEDLRECFALRHQVYDALGYLPDEVSAAPSQLEIDPFDTLSLHLAAKDWNQEESHQAVVGTVRLVTRTPYSKRHRLLADLKDLAEEQRRWTRELATDSALSDRVTERLTMPFPIFRNSDFGAKWPVFLNENQHRHGGEISRLVVSPKYRGYGVGRLLIRTAIAMAKYVDKQFLLIECIPSHTTMYKKFGFVALEGHHCRAQELDQFAVGMKLMLNGSPLVNMAVAIADSDLKLLTTSRFLCLCRYCRCWKGPGFEWKATNRCPLSLAHEQNVNRLMHER